jgi:Skp family chaperone for outer membrane proteins
MKKIIYFSSLCIIIISFNAYARKAERLVKIGCVDLNKVFELSEGKKIAENYLNKLKSDMLATKSKKEEEIKKLQTEYSNNYKNWDSDEREKKSLEIKQKIIELKEFIDQSNKKLEEEEAKLIEPIIEDIKDVIKAVSLKYGYSIIIDKSTYVLYVDKDFDITDEVIEELKVKYKEKKK